MKWMDLKVMAATSNPVIINIISVASAYLMLFLSLTLFFNSSYHLILQDKLMLLIFVCGLFLWIYGGFFFINRRKKVR